MAQEQQQEEEHQLTDSQHTHTPEGKFTRTASHLTSRTTRTRNTIFQVVDNSLPTSDSQNSVRADTRSKIF